MMCLQQTWQKIVFALILDIVKLHYFCYNSDSHVVTR